MAYFDQYGGNYDQDLQDLGNTFDANRMEQQGVDPTNYAIPINQMTVPSSPILSNSGYQQPANELQISNDQIDWNSTIDAPPPPDFETADTKPGPGNIDWNSTLDAPPPELSLEEAIQAGLNYKPPKTFLQALGTSIASIPENLAADVIAAVQGQTGASSANQDRFDKFYREVQERNANIQRDYSTSGVLNENVAQLGANLSFSIVSMLASLFSGLPVGGPLTPAGIAAGMAGGGLAAHRMQSYSEMSDWLDKKNKESIARTGRGLTADEEGKIRANLEDYATKSGLWEAGPEAVGNALELALAAATKGTAVGKILSAFVPKGKFHNLGVGLLRLGGTAATEQATETVTQTGQWNVGIESGMQEGKMRSWKSPSDQFQSFMEVLPQTMLLTGLMGAGGHVYRRLTEKGEEKVTANTESLDKLNSWVGEQQAAATSDAPVDPEYLRISKTYADTIGQQLAMAANQKDEEGKPLEYPAIQQWLGQVQQIAGQPPTKEDYASLPKTLKDIVDLQQGKKKEDVLAGYREELLDPGINPLFAYYQFMSQPNETDPVRNAKVFKSELDGMVKAGIIKTQEDADEILRKAVVEYEEKRANAPTVDIGGTAAIPEAGAVTPQQRADQLRELQTRKNAPAVAQPELAAGIPVSATGPASYLGMGEFEMPQEQERIPRTTEQQGIPETTPLERQPLGTRAITPTEEVKYSSTEPRGTQRYIGRVEYANQQQVLDDIAEFTKPAGFLNTVANDRMGSIAEIDEDMAGYNNLKDGMRVFGVTEPKKMQAWHKAVVRAREKLMAAQDKAVKRGEQEALRAQRKQEGEKAKREAAVEREKQKQEKAAEREVREKEKAAAKKAQEEKKAKEKGAGKGTTEKPPEKPPVKPEGGAGKGVEGKTGERKGGRPKRPAAERLVYWKNEKTRWEKVLADPEAAAKENANKPEGSKGGPWNERSEERKQKAIKSWIETAKNKIELANKKIPKIQAEIDALAKGGEEPVEKPPEEKQPPEKQPAEKKGAEQEKGRKKKEPKPTETEEEKLLRHWNPEGIVKEKSRWHVYIDGIDPKTKARSQAVATLNKDAMVVQIKIIHGFKKEEGKRGLPEVKTVLTDKQRLELTRGWRMNDRKTMEVGKNADVLKLIQLIEKTGIFKAQKQTPGMKGVGREEKISKPASTTTEASPSAHPPPSAKDIANEKIAEGKRELSEIADDLSDLFKGSDTTLSMLGTGVLSDENYQKLKPIIIKAYRALKKMATGYVDLFQATIQDLIRRKVPADIAHAAVTRYKMEQWFPEKEHGVMELQKIAEKYMGQPVEVNAVPAGMEDVGFEVIKPGKNDVTYSKDKNTAYVSVQQFSAVKDINKKFRKTIKDEEGNIIGEKIIPLRTNIYRTREATNRATEFNKKARRSGLIRFTPTGAKIDMINRRTGEAYTRTFTPSGVVSETPIIGTKQQIPEAQRRTTEWNVVEQVDFRDLPENSLYYEHVPRYKGTTEDVIGLTFLFDGALWKAVGRGQIQDGKFYPAIDEEGKQAKNHVVKLVRTTQQELKLAKARAEANILANRIIDREKAGTAAKDTKFLSLRDVTGIVSRSVAAKKKYNTNQEVINAILEADKQGKDVSPVLAFILNSGNPAFQIKRLRNMTEQERVEAAEVYAGLKFNYATRAEIDTLVNLLVDANGEPKIWNERTLAYNPEKDTWEPISAREIGKITNKTRIVEQKIMESWEEVKPRDYDDVKDLNINRLAALIRDWEENRKNNKEYNGKIEFTPYELVEDKKNGINEIHTANFTRELSIEEAQALLDQMESRYFVISGDYKPSTDLTSRLINRYYFSRMTEEQQTKEIDRLKRNLQNTQNFMMEELGKAATTTAKRIKELMGTDQQITVKRNTYIAELKDEQDRITYRAGVMKTYLKNTISDLEKHKSPVEIQSIIDELQNSELNQAHEELIVKQSRKRGVPLYVGQVSEKYRYRYQVRRENVAEYESEEFRKAVDAKTRGRLAEFQKLLADEGASLGGHYRLWRLTLAPFESVWQGGQESLIKWKHLKINFRNAFVTFWKSHPEAHDATFKFIKQFNRMKITNQRNEYSNRLLTADTKSRKMYALKQAGDVDGIFDPNYEQNFLDALTESMIGMDLDEGKMAQWAANIPAQRINMTLGLIDDMYGTEWQRHLEGFMNDGWKEYKTATESAAKRKRVVSAAEKTMRSRSHINEQMDKRYLEEVKKIDNDLVVAVKDGLKLYGLKPDFPITPRLLKWWYKNYYEFLKSYKQSELKDLPLRNKTAYNSGMKNWAIKQILVKMKADKAVKAGMVFNFRDMQAEVDQSEIIGDDKLEFVKDVADNMTEEDFMNLSSEEEQDLQEQNIIDAAMAGVTEGSETGSAELSAVPQSQFIGKTAQEKQARAVNVEPETWKALQEKAEKRYGKLATKTSEMEARRNTSEKNSLIDAITTKAFYELKPKNRKTFLSMMREKFEHIWSSIKNALNDGWNRLMARFKMERGMLDNINGRNWNAFNETETRFKPFLLPVLNKRTDTGKYWDRMFNSTRQEDRILAGKVLHEAMSDYVGKDSDFRDAIRGDATEEYRARGLYFSNFGLVSGYGPTRRSGVRWGQVLGYYISPNNKYFSGVKDVHRAAILSYLRYKGDTRWMQSEQYGIPQSAPEQQIAMKRMRELNSSGIRKWKWSEINPFIWKPDVIIRDAMEVGIVFGGKGFRNTPIAIGSKWNMFVDHVKVSGEGESRKVADYRIVLERDLTKDAFQYLREAHNVHLASMIAKPETFGGAVSVKKVKGQTIYIVELPGIQFYIKQAKDSDGKVSYKMMEIVDKATYEKFAGNTAKQGMYEGMRIYERVTEKNEILAQQGGETSKEMNKLGIIDLPKKVNHTTKHEVETNPTRNQLEGMRNRSTEGFLRILKVMWADGTRGIYAFDGIVPHGLMRLALGFPAVNVSSMEAETSYKTTYGREFIAISHEILPSKAEWARIKREEKQGSWLAKEEADAFFDPDDHYSKWESRDRRDGRDFIGREDLRPEARESMNSLMTLAESNPDSPSPANNQRFSLGMLRLNLPGASVTQEGEDRFTVHYPHYAYRLKGIEIEEVFDPETGEIKHRGGSWKITNGAGLMKLCKLIDPNNDPRNGLFHETFHMVADVFMTRNEQEMMLREFRRPEDQSDLAAWERAARAYAAWNESTPHTWWSNILNWAKRMMYDLRLMFNHTLGRNMDYDAYFREVKSAKEMFEKIASGEIMRREKIGRIAMPEDKIAIVNGEIFDPNYARKLQWADLALANGHEMNSLMQRIGLDPMNHPMNPEFVKHARNLWNWNKDELGLGIELEPRWYHRIFSIPVWLQEQFPVFKALLKTNQTADRRLQNDKHKYFFDETLTAHKLSRAERESLDPIFEYSTTIGKRYFTESELKNEATVKMIYTNPIIASKLTNYKLTDNAVKGYLEMSRFMEKVYKEQLEEAEYGLIAPYASMMKPGQFSVLKTLYHKYVKNKVDQEELKKFLDDPENKLAKNAYRDLTRKLDGIRKMRMEIGVQGGYFPLTHGKGSHYVAVMRKYTDEKGVERQEALATTAARSPREAMEIKEDWVKLFAADGIKPEDIQVRKSKRPDDSTYFMVGDMNMQRMVQLAMANMKNDPENNWTPGDMDKMQDTLLEALVDMKRARGGGSHHIQRRVLEYEKHKFVRGYKKENFISTMDGYVTGFYGTKAKFRKSMEYMRIAKEVKESQPSLYNQVQDYATADLRNKDEWDKTVRNLKSVAFYWFLAGKISTAVMQFTQNFVTAVPRMAMEMHETGQFGKHGPAAAERYMVGSLRDVVGSKQARLSDNERAMLKYLWDSGDLMAKQMEELGVVAENWQNKMWYKFKNLIALPMSGMETYNRRATALAYYRWLTDTTKLTEEQKYEKTQDFLDKTHWSYGPHNYPEFARGGTGVARGLSLGYTFLSFPHNYVLSMVDAFTNPKHTKKSAAIYVGRSLAWLWLFGGAAALPFLDDLLEMMERKLGIPLRQQMRKKIKETMGAPTERFYSAGVPGMIGYIDISGAIKPAGIPTLGKPAEMAFGVFAGLGKKLQKTVQSAGDRDYLRAVENASPTFIENALKAYRLSDVGVTTSTGLKVLGPEGKPIRTSPYEASAQSLGFSPYNYAALMDERRSQMVSKEHWVAMKERFTRMMHRADTPKAQNEIRKEWYGIYDRAPVEIRRAKVVTRELSKTRTTQMKDVKFWKDIGTVSQPL